MMKAAGAYPPDDELLRRMMAGDEAAFAALYARHQRGVYRFALHMSGSPSVAEDVTQEVFMVLMRDAAKFDPTRGSLAAFLYGVARNHVLRSIQRERPYVQLAGDDAGDELSEGLGAHDDAPAQSDPLGDLTRHETIEAVRQAVLALPPHYREVVIFCELQEMSYAETADALGCAVGTVRSRLHRARSLLVEKLGATRAAGDQPARPAESRSCYA